MSASGYVNVNVKTVFLNTVYSRIRLVIITPCLSMRVMPKLWYVNGTCPLLRALLLDSCTGLGSIGREFRKYTQLLSLFRHKVKLLVRFLSQMLLWLWLNGKRTSCRSIRFRKPF